MRRSKAPSVLNNAKRIGENENFLGPEEQYDWGSRNFKSTKHKRIFSVLWRDASNRKHKIWKGDGSLEVDSVHLKAVLKDETGKYMGCLTKVDVNVLVPDFQMIISGKEVEIQNEIKADEMQNLRKMQVESMTNNDYTFRSDNSEEASTPKGGFIFKPILVPPKLAAAERTSESYSLKGRERKMQSQCEFLRDKNKDIKPSVYIPLKTKVLNEFICFLKPSELQQYLFQKTLEYLSFKKSENIEYLDVELVLKMVCNHPSLINHKKTNNELLRHLIPVLPDWTEMGPFDSSKLEFVQYFLTGLNRSSQTCLILAKNSNVLNMLQGLCDFMRINCLRLNSNDLQNFESQVRSSEDGSVDVILLNSLEIISYSKLSTFCKKIIVFEEYSEFSHISLIENSRELTIYYLVTAFSIEELFLLDTCKNIENLLNDLGNTMNMEYDCCYLHSKIECNCFRSVGKALNTENHFIKYWNHFKTPFDLQLLQVNKIFFEKIS